MARTLSEYVLSISFVLLSLSIGFSQESKSIYSYEKYQPTTTIVESGQLDSFISYEKVVLEALDSKVPFYRFSNEKVPEKNYVILVHGLGGNKMNWIHPSKPYLQFTENLKSIKDSLLNIGFDLVIVDLKYHGERTHELNFRDPAYLPPMRSKNIADANIFYDLVVSSVKELRLIMDYLDTLHKDHNVTFNFVGYSMGGGISLIINSVDDRINTVVACVPPLTRPYIELEELDWPEEIEARMKAISAYYIATNQKSPVSLLIGESDFFISKKEAKDFYDKIPIDDKELIFYDSGHELPEDYVQDVISWIKQHNEI